MVHGKPRHPQSQGSVERANGDIKDMLISWMNDNDTNDWSVGIKFVQFYKNSSLHSGIKHAPYSAMFGCEAKVGLTSSSLPAEVIARLQSEDDLVTALTGTQQAPTSTQVPSETTPSTSDSIEVVSTEDVVISDSADVVNESTDDTSESTETATECVLSKRLDKIVSERGCAKRAMGVQAERMVKRSRVEVPHGQIGDNVIIPIPLVDRGRGDPRNILGIILDRDENDLYTISVKSGILTSKYSRNQFDICS